MNKSLVSVELDLIVEDGQGFNPDFEMMSDNWLITTRNNSLDVKVECVDSKLLEVTSLVDDEEITTINNRAVIGYYLSSNNRVKMSDMIRLKDRGDFNIIINSRYSFLFNSETGHSIELSYVKNIDELNTYLKFQFNDYEVLRKVE